MSSARQHILEKKQQILDIFSQDNILTERLKKISARILKGHLKSSSRPNCLSGT